MLKINGNRLSAEGVEFMLPNGFYIDIEGMESVDKNGLRLVPKEKDCFIWMRTETDEFKTAMESLIDRFSDFIFESGSQMELLDDEEKTDYQWIVKPTTYTYNGLSGAYTTYTALTRDMYCLHLNRVKGYNERFIIYMQVDRTKTSIEKVFARPHVKDFFSSICREEK